MSQKLQRAPTSRHKPSCVVDGHARLFTNCDFGLSMEQMKSMIRDRPYESDTLQVLEAFVTTEYSSINEAYSFDANKALIKIYQAFPEHMKAELLANIFEMALVRSVSTRPPSFQLNSFLLFDSHSSCMCNLSKTGCLIMITYYIHR